jgi:hypothetical protein
MVTRQGFTEDQVLRPIVNGEWEWDTKEGICHQEKSQEPIPEPEKPKSQLIHSSFPHLFLLPSLLQLFITLLSARRYLLGTMKSPVHARDMEIVDPESKDAAPLCLLPAAYGSTWLSFLFTATDIREQFKGDK